MLISKETRRSWRRRADENILLWFAMGCGLGAVVFHIME